MKPIWKTALLSCVALVCPIAAGLIVSLAWVPWGRPYISILEGRQTFASKCAHCHSDALNLPAGQGPSLATVGSDAASRIPGVSATEYLVESILAPAAFQGPGRGKMPVNVAKNIPDAGVRNLVAYLASLGGEPDYDSIGSMDISSRRSSGRKSGPLDLEQIERGRSLFLGAGKCVNCHTLRRNAESGLIAPMLHMMVNHDEQYLRESIENPSAVIVPGYQQQRVATSEGKIYAGRLMKQDAQQLVLLTVNPVGQLQPQVITHGHRSAAELTMTPSNVSTMPTLPLTPSEIDDLVAFLVALSE